MTNPVNPTAPGAPLSLFTRGAILTKSDSTVIERTRGLYVGGGGDLSVKMADGGTLLLSAVPTGTVLNIAVTQLRSTNTTATLVAALY